MTSWEIFTLSGQASQRFVLGLEGVDRFELNEELMLAHVDTLYLSSTGEPNRERFQVVSAPAFAVC